MQLHAPKRIYSPQMLEFWFGKLETDWSAHFTPAQLAEGRRIYRAGEIRELELTGSTAIVHRRNEKRDEYTVIEWDKTGALAIRSSTTAPAAARSLAVAGLHEIEELICDEIPPVAGLRPEVASNKYQVAGTTAPRSGADSLATCHLPLATSPRSGAVRPLILAFATQPDGLGFRAYWKNPDGTRAPAPLSFTSAERAKLIALAAYARKAHFAYDQKTGNYLLSAIAEIPAFLKNTLPAWRKLFTIELDPRAAKLLNTPLAVEITAAATAKRQQSFQFSVFSFQLPASNTSGGATASTENCKLKTENCRNSGAAPAALELRWLFKAGERLLTDSEIALLTKRPGSTALLPDIGIVTLPADRLETLKNWQRTLAETQTAEDALPPSLIFSLFNDARLKLTLSPEVETWRQAVLTPPPETAPLALPEVLRPYQRRGVEWLAHLRDTGCHALLADEMGLGKTLQVIALLTARPADVAQTAKSADEAQPRPIQNPKSKIENSLIVCPASVVPVWQEEFKKFAPHVHLEILKNGNDFTKTQTLNTELGTLNSDNAPGVVWIASYAQLRKHRAQLDTTRFTHAILDEGQFIKNPDAKTTQTCFAIRAAHRIVLSGTPLENRQLDLFSIFRYLLPGLLGTRSAFEAALAADRDATLARLRAQLAPFILRRTKAEVATELPPKVEMDLLCPLTPVQRAEYARVCAEGLARLGDDMDAALRERSFSFLALLTRLRQICCDPDMLPWRHDTPLTDSGKITQLLNTLAEVIAGGHKVVIFSQFVMLLARVRAALAQTHPTLPIHEITGMTRDRLNPVQTFQTTPGAAAMLVSLKAGGTGITLHAADYIFLLDPWWNPAVEAQAVDRVHRIGQSKTVFVYRMVTTGTIEERIQTLKETKRDLFEKLVGNMTGDHDLTRHFQSLRDLVQLTTPEVVESEPAGEPPPPAPEIEAKNNLRAEPNPP